MSWWNVGDAVAGSAWEEIRDLEDHHEALYAGAGDEPAWCCRSCGAGLWGTPPGHGLCPACARDEVIT